MQLLAELGIDIAINPMPNEVADPISFPEDNLHASYDAGAAHRFWRALVQIDRLFKLFRSGFLGKASPVHFFWGSFDLAVTRFSARARSEEHTSELQALMPIASAVFFLKPHPYRRKES